MTFLRFLEQGLDGFQFGVMLFLMAAGLTLVRVYELVPRLGERSTSMDNHKRAGQSILIIDKSVKALTRIADRHDTIAKGKVVWQGSSPELSANDEVQHRYLGV